MEETQAHNVYNDGAVHVCRERCSTCIFRSRPGTPCEEWRQARNEAGYGIKRVNGRNVRAHRWAWEQAYGPIPDDKIVMHKCDNPPCYRLDHLTLGTHKDNSDDKFAKGRANTLRGEATGRARLTEAQVYRVLQLLQEGRSQRSIAREFGVSPGAIQHIADGRNWKHIVQYERGNLMHLNPGTVKSMVDQTSEGGDGSTIVCHKTLDTEQNAVCRGWLETKVGQDDVLMRMAYAMKVVKEIDPG